MIDPIYQEIRKKLDEMNNTTVHIALFGQPGAGKSSLINTLTGQRLANVGVENDVTVARQDYDYNGLYLSDLPGYGTEKFPEDTYFEKFDIPKFDLFLCVTSGKLKADDVKLFKNLAELEKKCIFVRNKIDDSYEPDVTTEELHYRIKKNIYNEIGADKYVILTSCRTKEGIDELTKAIKHSLDSVKREKFIQAAAAYSKEILDQKKAACQKYAILAAAASGMANLIPIPAVGISADIGLITTYMEKIRKDFHLTESTLDKYATLAPTLTPLFNSVISTVTTEGVLLLLKQFGTRMVVSETSKYIPTVGSVIAGGISFTVVVNVLNDYIDTCYKLAEEMLNTKFQG